jgi:unconventional prefoldin RPB5 interactor 1
MAAAAFIDESPEDATVRRQMLQYGMQEVGAIVAEMDIDDSDSYTSYSETDGSEEEDQFGRTNSRMMTDDYREQMLELERKLNAKSLINIGPNPDATKASAAVIDKAAQGAEDQAGSNAPLVQTKGVRFAEKLDVSETLQSNRGGDKAGGMPTVSNRPVLDSIVERTVSSQNISKKSQSGKISRFKSSRVGSVQDVAHDPAPGKAQGVIANGPVASHNPAAILKPAAKSTPEPYSSPILNKEPYRIRTVPNGPPGKTHSKTIIERPVAENEATSLEPDEFDPALMGQQLAVEYHRMRNQMIHQEGGFMQQDEPANIPVDENGNEYGGEKMSRFRAARLSKLG